MDKAATPAVAESINRHVSWLEEEITKLDKECQEPLQSSAALNQRAPLYRTVPGVGISTPAILIAPGTGPNGPGGNSGRAGTGPDQECRNWACRNWACRNWACRNWAFGNLRRHP